MSSQQKIAIVGIGCRFPGGVDNVDEFWKVRLHDLKTIYVHAILLSRLLRVPIK